MCTAVGGAFGGEYLGQHAAPANGTACAPSHGFKRDITGLRFAYQRGSWVMAWIGGIKPGLISQNHQCIGFDEVRHQRA